MGYEEDPQDLDEIIFTTLLVDDREDVDSGWGCGGCLATALVFIAALALLGLAAACVGSLLAAR